MARARLYLGDAHVEAARNALSPGEEQQHRESSIVAYEAVISLEPGQRMLTLQAHSGLAILEWDAGDLASAQERLTSLLMEDPDYVDALVNLGGVHFSRARESRGADRESLQRATQLYERALRLAPGRYEARLNLGACYHLSGDLPMAQAAYEAVVEQAPGDGLAALNLGTLYLQRARQEPRSADWHLLAQEQLQRAVRLLPGNESARRALAAALAGEAR
jgi:tetratricopeptide (TPR) repeat protein